ncbi:MAG: hypothetical protein JNK53_07600, partial [Phycisphaerae bacterium]|nr:hypothetical protein [Phycisphaerae bacterium]
WTVLDDAKVKVRDLEFAMAAAKAGVTASKGEDAAIMDTLARAYWDTGDKSMAIETQQKAVELSKDDAGADSIKDTLKKYQEGTPPAAPSKKAAGKSS